MNSQSTKFGIFVYTVCFAFTALILGLGIYMLISTTKYMAIADNADYVRFVQAQTYGFEELIFTDTKTGERYTKYNPLYEYYVDGLRYTFKGADYIIAESRPEQQMREIKVLSKSPEMQVASNMGINTLCIVIGIIFTVVGLCLFTLSVVDFIHWCKKRNSDDEKGNAVKQEEGSRVIDKVKAEDIVVEIELEE